ncbi:YIP1 family protein [Cellulosilyticum ruminicola]|uniref:YIP1 family protein n=1 Tax=Cellulosilyticum ruminicola TaxID=425254 RepID=UPI0006D03866|nr:YIP1 family protein [Cellulosilyticum ruminicola]
MIDEHINGDNINLPVSECEYIADEIPWYKCAISLFTHPRKTISQSLANETPYGLAWSSILSIILGIAYILTLYINPIEKEEIYNLLRNSGISEQALQQQFIISMISSIFMVIIGIFASALIVSACFQVLKLFFKDKVSFKSLFALSVYSIFITYSLNLVDNILKLITQVNTSVLSISAFFSQEILKSNFLLQTVCNTISIPTLYSIVIMVIGYSVLTKKSTLHATIVMLIYQVIALSYSYGLLVLSHNLSQSIQL